MDEEEDRKPPTLWHYLFGRLLEKVLGSVNILVYPELSVMSQPPKADVLLLRREGSFWTDEQRKRLPDGVRDSFASNILLEFKYTESLDEKAFQQALCYRTFYQQAKELASEEVQAFVISSKTPQKKRITGWDYALTKQAGVYHSDNWLLKDIPLLVLNELPPTPHNAWIKCFASRQKEKQNAFDALRQEAEPMTTELAYFLNFLQYLMREVSDMKANEIGTDFKQQMLELENRWKEWYFSQKSTAERLAGLDPKEVVGYFDPKEVVNQLSIKQRLMGLSIEDIEVHLTQLKQKRKRKRT
ncbi:MAG: hypothetical protein DRR19_01795 [Candidatus Parabeggiatoa sp. nov. 1]|nr:MAG: hypothetical protein DRR19_01795 [Gammaproteobacteria bacterium]